MNPQIIIALIFVAFGSGFGFAWEWQSLRTDRKEKAHAEQQLVDQRLAAATTVRRLDNGIQAQNAAVSRNRDLRDAAAGSRDALIGLHNASAIALRESSASLAACTDRAAAISVVLDQCGAAYQGLGEVCDRHTSDIKTMIDAWPK